MAKNRKRQDNTAASEEGGTITQERAIERSENGDRTDKVAARAYELYLARGGSHGNDWDDWLEAERQINQDDTGPTSD